MADKPAVNAAWTDWLSGYGDSLPTRTTVCIDDLGPATLFEIVLTAAVVVEEPTTGRGDSKL
jgi:enamine deaminase RidA (YjgF/YER057c/UK114 family)